MWQLAIAIGLAGLVGMGADALFIDLGPANQEHGLVVRSYGDGVNKAASLGGRDCRVVDRSAGGNFLYVQAEPRPAPCPALYVTVDYFDQSGELTVEYDAGEAGAYRASPDVLVQRGTGRWRTGTFLLRGPALGGGQNGGADLRVGGTGSIALARIALSPAPPAGYTSPQDPVAMLAARPPARVSPGMTVIQQWQIHEPVAPGRLSDSAYITARKIGITSLQSYVGWAQLEPEEGRVTYATYDPVVSQIRKHGLKWLPFLITAPYVATPRWFRTKSGVDAVCLEHNQTTPIQSIWNPNLRAGVRRFLELFRAHYEPEVIEALNLGISGNWGESLMPAGGGFDMAGQHTHAGWWCGDPYARADFRRWARERYRTAAALNAAWATTYRDFDDVQPGKGSSRRATADFVAWYTQSMTDYAEFWVKTARELYPTLPIYLCTGGDGLPMLGADFGGQARMCAKYGAGIRITNQGDDAAANFAITRMVGSACRLYGQYYTTEPGGDNSPWGIAGRVFDATAGGSRGAYFKYLMDEPDLPTLKGIRFMENARYLVPNKPRLPVAAVMPNASMALDGGVLRLFLDRAAKLRDAVDFEFIDEGMIADGLLGKFRAVVLLAGDTLEARTIEKLRAWTASGGVTLAPAALLPLRSVEGDEAAWLHAPGSDPAKVRAAMAMPSASGVRLDVGSGSEEALDGQWHGAEGAHAPRTAEAPDPSFRWTAGACSATLPVPAGPAVIVRVYVEVPAAVGDGALTVNGVEVARLSPGPLRWVEAEVPVRVLAGAQTAVVGFRSHTWVPDPARDPRALGMAVHEIRLQARGARDADVVPLEELQRKVTIRAQAAIALSASPMGKGYTVVWPGDWATYLHLLNAAVHAADAPWKQIARPIDAAFDGVLASRVGRSVQYYNNTDADISKKLAGGTTLVVKARSITASTGR